MSAVEATLVIALVGLVLSLGSLSWQVISFVRSGGRIRVESRFGVFLLQGRDELDEVIEPLTFENQAQTWALIKMDKGTLHGPLFLPSSKGPKQLDNTWLVADVKNVGRLPVTVSSCRWHSSSNEWLGSLSRHWPGTDLPHRLNPYDQCIVTVHLQEIVDWWKEDRDEPFPLEFNVWPIVELASGQTAKGPPLTLRSDNHVADADADADAED